VTSTLEFVQRHGHLVVFVWVFLDQLGVPIPVVPLLMGIGVLAGAGKISLATAVGVVVTASLLADVAWFSLGRRRGHHVLTWLCRITLEPDSCVRRTETMFLARGLQALLIAKFLPGLNAVAAALAGIVGVHAGLFVGYAAAGGLLWAGTWIGLGYLFSNAIEELVASSAHLGISVVTLLAAALGAYVLVKYVQRWRFLRALRIARITPDELKQRLDSGEDVVILDLRTALDVATMAYTIPGALRVAAEDLEQRRAELPRDREIVLFCT
jgi:membrane protein DedA with SNARE-associated domain